MKELLLSVALIGALSSSLHAMEEQDISTANTPRPQIAQSVPSIKSFLQDFEENKKRVQDQIDHFDVKEAGAKWRVYNAQLMDEQCQSHFPELKNLSSHELVDAIFTIGQDGTLTVNYNKLPDTYTELRKRVSKEIESTEIEVLPRNFNMPFLLESPFYNVFVSHLDYGVLATFHMGKYEQSLAQ